MGKRYPAGNGYPLRSLPRALAAVIERLPPGGLSLYALLAFIVMTGSTGALAWPVWRVTHLNPVEALGSRYIGHPPDVTARTPACRATRHRSSAETTPGT